MPKTALGSILPLAGLYLVDHPPSTCFPLPEVILWLNESQLNTNSEEGPGVCHSICVQKVHGCKLPIWTNGRAWPLIWDVCVRRGVEMVNHSVCSFSSYQRGQLAFFKL